MKRFLNPSLVLPLVCSMSLTTALVLSACGGNDTTTPNASPLAAGMATPIGVANGKSSSVTVGPAGGSVQSSDGRLKLDIPAGALATDTLIGVQPITNNAHGALGGAFRLTPVGQTFAKPVTMAFAYTDAELADGDPSALGAAFQTASGAWQWLDAPVADAATKTVRINTTHFTDYATVTGYRITPTSKTVKVKQTQALKVVLCYNPTPSNLTPLALPCDSADAGGVLPDVNITDWSVNGVVGGSATTGTVRGDGVNALYIAPLAKPTPNLVSVSAQMTLLGKKIRMVSNITIAGDTANYMGDTTFSLTQTGVTVTEGKANVAWALIEDLPDVKKYQASGNMSAVVTYEGCAPKAVSSPIQGAASILLVYTSAAGFQPNTHAFNLVPTQDVISVSCSGVTVQAPNPMFSAAVVGGCNGTFPPLPPFTDVSQLKGTWTCAQSGITNNVGWSFISQ